MEDTDKDYGEFLKSYHEVQGLLKEHTELRKFEPSLHLVLSDVSRFAEKCGWYQARMLDALASDMKPMSDVFISPCGRLYVHVPVTEEPDHPDVMFLYAMIGSHLSYAANVNGKLVRLTDAGVASCRVNYKVTEGEREALINPKTRTNIDGDLGDWSLALPNSDLRCIRCGGPPEYIVALKEGGLVFLCDTDYASFWDKHPTQCVTVWKMKLDGR